MDFIKIIGLTIVSWGAAKYMKARCTQSIDAPSEMRSGIKKIIFGSVILRICHVIPAGGSTMHILAILLIGYLIYKAADHIYTL